VLSIISNILIIGRLLIAGVIGYRNPLPGLIYRENFKFLNPFFSKFAGLKKKSTLTIRPSLNNLNRAALVELTPLLLGSLPKLTHKS
jgi:hypothetical protein